MRLSIRSLKDLAKSRVVPYAKKFIRSCRADGVDLDEKTKDFLVCLAARVKNRPGWSWQHKERFLTLVVFGFYVLERDTAYKWPLWEAVTNYYSLRKSKNAPL